MKRLKQIDKKLYRGSHPVTESDFDALANQLGIKLIINLESGIWERFKGDINFETEQAAKFGMDVIHLHTFVQQYL